MEAAVTRRLDRLSKQNERLEFQIEVANEALALDDAPLRALLIETAQAIELQAFAGTQV